MSSKSEPHPGRTVIAILAAGASRRFGRPKQLLDYRGKPLIRHAAEMAVAAAPDETIVIVPPDQFHQELSGLPLTIIDNAHADEGVSASIRLAVEVAAGARIVFMLVDQPRVTPEHLRALIESDSPIVATGYSGTIGVPAAFDARFAPELLALRGDRGARSVIEAHRDLARVIAFEDAAVDVDTEADYRRL